MKRSAGMSGHFRYLSYVLRHKWHVFWTCIRLRVPLHQAVVHDWQKFLPVEWFPYVDRFCGPGAARRDAGGDRHAPAGEAFERAWLHHQRLGPHHWQHWVPAADDGARARAMPERYVREMVADWIGAARAQGHEPDPHGFYAAKRDRMRLHPDTRRYLEDLLSARAWLT